MSDLFVHQKMKNCCRETLEKLDKICSTVTGQSKACTKLSLAKQLGELPIPIATIVIFALPIISAKQASVSENALSDGLGEQALQKFNEACKDHEEKHRNKKEHREANFWAALRGESFWLPNHVPTGTATYYQDRYDDFLRRHPDLPPPSYYLNYGNEYFGRFQTKVKPTLSENGKKWIDDAAKKLQEKMEAKVGSTNAAKLAFDALERDDDAFTAFAYSTHCSAYDEAGIGSLSGDDLYKIQSEPDWLDSYLSWSWWKQAGCVVWENPGTAPATAWGAGKAGAGAVYEGAETGAKAVADILEALGKGWYLQY